MVVIGLTGGIGSGKSTVSGMLKELGAVVVDADKVGHELLKRPSQAWAEIVATFGEEVLGPDGEINRGRLGEKVFKDPQAVDKLNQIMHPRIYGKVEEVIAECRKKGTEVVVVEASVLIEAGWPPLVDEIWITAAPLSTVVERVKKRGGLTEEQILDRINHQMSTEEKLRYADVVIDTDCTLSEVRAKVEKLWKELRERRAAGERPARTSSV